MNMHSLPDGTATPPKEAGRDVSSQTVERGTVDHATVEARISPSRQLSAKHIVLPFPPASASARPVRDAPAALPDEKGERGKEVSSATPTPTPFPLSPLLASPSADAGPPPAVSLPEDDDVFTAAPRGNPVIKALKDAGLYVQKAEKRQHVVTCPWANEHGEHEHGSARYIEPSPQRPLGAYVCPNTHAEPPRMDRFLDRLSVEASAARCKPRIRLVPGEMVRIVERAEKVLNAVGGYYQSGGAIVTIKQTAAGDAVSIPISEQALIKAFALASDWEKYDGSTKAWRRCDPAPQIAKQLLSSQPYEHLPALEHIARQPYFREADGALVTEPGYDGVSRTFAAFQGNTFPAVPSSYAAARAALDELRELLTEFQFASEVDCAATLCAILTAAARSSLPLAPAFNVTASTPGSGKSYLGNLLGAFAGPGEPLNLSYPTTSDEATKAMLAALIGKPAVISFDDMQTDWIPHGIINRMLTSETVADRLLGSNNTKQVGTKAFVMGTGNNVSPVRDMCRRVVTIALRPRTASPATLRYEGKPVEKVRAARERYVSLALTIIHAWRTAALSRADVLDIATFGAWSDMCRQPLIWLGEHDPATSLIAQVQHDPDTEEFGRMMTAWYALFGSKATTLRKVTDRAKDDVSLNEAIMDLPVVDFGTINHKKLGWFLKKNANRIVDGMYVQKEPSSERNAWSVQLVNPASAPSLAIKPSATRTRIREETQLPDGSVLIDGEIY